jgi:large subunit ribosomal protein L31
MRAVGPATLGKKSRRAIVFIVGGVKPPGKESLLTQHPNLNFVDVRCSSCGGTFTLHTTAGAISVDVCSNCHPAYTGRARSLAASDRVERFNRRRALAV